MKNEGETCHSLQASDAILHLSAIQFHTIKISNVAKMLKGNFQKNISVS